MFWLLDNGILILGAASLSFVAALLVTLGLGYRYQLAFDRMPAATRLAGLEALIGEKQGKLQDLEKTLESARATESERKEAERSAHYWRRETEAAKAAYDALGHQRREIEETAEQLRKVLEDLAIWETALQEKKSALELAEKQKRAAEADLETAGEKLGKLEQQRSSSTSEIAASEQRLAALRDEKETLKRDVEQVRDVHRQLETEIKRLEAEVGRLEHARQAAADVENQAKAAEARLEALKKEVIEAEDERGARRARQESLAQAIEEKQNAEHRLQARLDHLEKEITEREQVLNGVGELDAELADKKDQVAGLKVKREALEQSIEAKERTENRLQGRLDDLETEICRREEALDGVEARDAELAESQQQFDKLKTRREALEQSIEEKERIERRLQARLAALQDEIEGTDTSPDGERRDHQALADLTKPPACLVIERPDGSSEPVKPNRLGDEQEAAALARVKDHLDASRLEFSERTLHAFHTSLKTAVISPLTVLAGISGTGKSQLPRYYAEAMGMHFLKIPVQPRWDGPQDLFGFYNYIEKRYKATDLARALVHLDPHNWPDLAEAYQDRMLIVLLDEMNLARVEYYFSEFLSRLEGRPLDEARMGQSDRQPVEIDIEANQSSQAKRVYVGQNVLFVGTMNEDESTLALSDKVLDRANVLRFPKPPELKEELPINDDEHVAGGYMPKSRWMQDWIRSGDDLPTSQHDKASGIIRDINDIMGALGRPFGHRMGQAMLHYAANYPGTTQEGARIEMALADQIELRILPRIRGIQAEEHPSSLNELAELAKDQLADGDLAEEIDRTVRRSRETNGLFVWRGLTRKS